MTFTRSALAVVGSINQDVVLSVADFPLPGQTLLAGGAVRATGGKGANQALAASMAGARVGMFGCVGEDSGGEDALALLTSYGVNAEGIVRTPQASTGSAYVCVRGDGENFIVVEAGANALIRPDRFSAEDFAPYGWVLMNLEIPLETVGRVAELAQQAGCRVALNASPLGGAVPPLEHVDLILANEGEAAQLARSEWGEDAGLAETLGVPTAVITRGARGATLDAAGTPQLHASAEAVAVRDTTGCGDAFAGVLLSRLCAGHSAQQSVQEAARWAAYVAEHEGAAASYPLAFQLARKA
ncbi:ribokinase [Nesterenkonia populi]|uniref:ribokinase n=1 Tax=Nesterenkonia populi TaxID=1591087 RepID=UPI0011BE229C|nr:ribokinase [Nesterenkonia populi]